MKNTVLVTTAWLEHPEYYKKTEKFVEYYKPFFDHIAIIDNGSKKNNFALDDDQVVSLTQIPHMPRKSHLEYPYLWRAVYGLKYFFNDTYNFDRILYIDNDFYITSQKMMDWVKSIDSGWNTAYCKAYNFNETGFQVIHKDCKEYQEFVKDGEFWKHNGKVMEQTLPVTNVNKDLIGNRWAEIGITKQDSTWDFSAQTLLDMEIKFTI